LKSRLGLSEQDTHLCTLESAEGTDVAEQIIAVAERIQARLVVLHAGRVGGTVSDITMSVICRIGCPALVVRPDLDLRSDAEGRWLRHILVPLDSSPGSAEAVRRATELARRENATLDILHIASPRDLPPSEPGSLPVGLYIDHPHYDLKSWSREFMRRFFHISVGAVDAPTPKLHLSTGDPADEILRYADRTKADLIVSAWQGCIDEGRAGVVRELLARAHCQLLFLVIGRTSKVANFGKTAAA
jgi:nucleotide-binding universal stress UspA family protein